MEIRNLITFARVAELGSFTRAARALSYSQSTVSFQIKQLESELDCLLFERINHTVSLTERGRELLAYAQKIEHLTEDFRGGGESPERMTARLRVAAPDSVCEEMLTKNYVDFHRQYPGIDLEFTNADTATMFRMLDHNEVDLIITLDSRFYKKGYVVDMEEPVEMRFVTGARSEYAAAKTLSLDELAELPLILTEHGVGYRRVLDEALARHSLEILPTLEIGRTDIVTAMLEQGVGVSFLPAFVCEKKVRQGDLVYLDVPELELSVWKQLLHHRSKWLSRSLAALIEYIKLHEFEKEKL